jgi:hypothetical protein
VPAIFTLIAYWLFWFIGLALNLYFLRDAQKLYNATGQKQPNVGCLHAMLWFNILPFVALMVALFFLGGNF